MLLWLEMNFATILISIFLLIIVTVIVVKMVKDKQNGRTSCGHGCENCAMHGRCHK